MPRLQPVVRKVNALEAQGRMILWLECKHTVSYTLLQLASSKGEMQRRIEDASEWMCPFCPTPNEIRQLTPQQLWRAAGEPE